MGKASFLSRISLLSILFCVACSIEADVKVLSESSANWKINLTLTYTKVKGEKYYVVKPEVNYIGKDSIDYAAITIHYKNNSSTVNTIDISNSSEVLNLPTRSKVGNWNGIEFMEIKWNKKKERLLFDKTE
ncbi:hypothetical protein PAEVO_43390 [Paenibacillus sp. GM2FR]|uniref:hypothetical protein n=1 Tax=Paenibacillus sp. GM2FR TaxID=2059268 RepID=UPI000C27D7A2|nr:hypothetical protein [Paenibacillus sp. GM2FR]PJN51248.1 hypothetical protein PAEVO_43390 [Paenibacillus sp. GM2FR]